MTSTPPPSNPPKIGEHRFVSFDGTPIFYRTVHPGPDTPLRATTLILHGMGEHGGRYLALADFLAQKGVASYLPDHRGFGLSAGARGVIRSFTDFQADTKALFSIVRTSHPGSPVYLLGHSMGGLIATAVSAEMGAALSGLILSSPLFEIAIPVPPLKRVIADILYRILPDWTQSSGLNPDDLTHDQVQRQHRVKDPLIHDRISAGLFAQIGQAMRSVQTNISTLCVPTLVLQAGEDRIVSRVATERIFRQIGASDKELKIFPGWYHEIFNEVGRDEAYQKVSSWMLARIPSKR